MPRDGALILSDVRNPTLSIVRRSEGPAMRRWVWGGGGGGGGGGFFFFFFFF